MKVEKQDTTYSSIDVKEEEKGNADRGNNEYEPSEESKVSEGDEDDSA